MKTSENREIKPSRISTPNPKLRKYLYSKIMAYTVYISSITMQNYYNQGGLSHTSLLQHSLH